MLVGQYDYAIDAKGRLNFPARFRDAMGETFIVTRWLDHCLAAFPAEEFEKVAAKIEEKGLVKGRTTPDGRFTLTEVECLGACTNAPMVQINDDNYEDLDYDSTVRILEALAAGEQPKAGTQLANRHTSEPDGGPTTLKEMVSSNHDYRKEW